MEVRNRVKKLCGRLRQSLEEGGDWQKDEEWEQARERACWLGKKGNGWGFFSPQELAWKDDEYRSELFKNDVPFWGFDNDLLELAKELGVEGCYVDSDIEFNYYGKQEEDSDWSRKVRGLGQNISDFLNSPLLCGEHGEEKSAEILERLSVRQVEKLEVKFELKGISIPDPNPRQSFLEVTDQESILWLASDASENQYPWLIGDALQDYFGNIKELSGFVEDLLTKDKDKDHVLTRWKQKGLQTNTNVPSSEDDSKDNEEDSAPVDAKFPGKTDSRDGVPEGDESDAGTPSVHEGPETGNWEGDSTGSAPTTPSPGGHWGGVPTTRTGTGGHSGRGGGGEGEAHRNLKNYLADNPSELDEGFKLVKTEYRFTSGDEADILFEDSSKNPITVEVETHISSGNYVGVWQAVKYQHLAAVEYNLPCEEVRSILAAPEIPNDVKEECKKRGIEPIEISD